MRVTARIARGELQEEEEECTGSTGTKAERGRRESSRR